MTKNGKSYSTYDEFVLRENIFAHNEEQMKVVNEDLTNDVVLGNNQFSTWTMEEKSKLLGYKGPQLKDMEAPEAKEWRDINIQKDTSNLKSGKKTKGNKKKSRKDRKQNKRERREKKERRRKEEEEEEEKDADPIIIHDRINWVDEGMVAPVEN